MDLDQFKAEAKQTARIVEEHYGKVEDKTDSLLQKAVNSRFTVLIIGGAVGVVLSFYLIAC